MNRFSWEIGKSERGRTIREGVLIEGVQYLRKKLITLLFTAMLNASDSFQKL